MSWLGIDVGARRLHLAVLDDRGGVALDVCSPDELARWLAASDAVPVERATVDAPSGWADDAHAEDDRVAPKYRRRCAEAVLALRDPPHFVSWPSPAADELDAPAHGWVAAGIEVHGTLTAATVPTDECWPHASWQRLADARRLPAKSSAEGLAVRRRLLGAAGVQPAPLADAGHDHLDAVVAAFTAATLDAAEVARATCSRHGPAGGAIVLPTRSTLR